MSPWEYYYLEKSVTGLGLLAVLLVGYAIFMRKP
jgi:preprotein translocase subunit Sss1